MPQVPYQPYSTEQPISGTGARGISVATPPEAFGGATAAALQHLGQVTSQAGNELFARAEAMQDLKNRTEANDLAINAEIAMSDAYTKFSSLEGKNAVGAQAGFNEELKRLQKEYSGQASNSAVQRMVDMQTKGTMARTIFSGARHAATEQKAWTLQSATDRIAMNEKAVLDNPRDEGEFQRRKRENDRLIDTRIQIKGLDKVSADRAKFESNSKLRASQLDGWIRDEPLSAMDRIEEFKHELTNDDYKRLYAQGMSKVGQVVPENVAKEEFVAGQATAEAPAKPLKEMEDAVEKRLTRQYPNDPLMAKHGVAAIQRMFNQRKYAEQQEYIERKQVVDEGIMMSGARTVQELTAFSPKVNAAYNALPDHDKISMPGRLNRYHDESVKVRNEAEWARLTGLKDNDPEAFLNEDILSSDLPKSDKNKFLAEQAKIKGQAIADPRVQRDQGWMRSAFPRQLEALGIFRRTEQNKDDYDKYSGMLRESIEAYQHAHGKPPDYDAITKVIGPQIISKVSEPGFWNRITGGLIPTTRETPFYLQSIPEDWKLKWIEKQRAAGIEPTTDQEQLLTEYTQWLAIQMFGKRGTPSGAVKAPMGPR